MEIFDELPGKPINGQPDHLVDKSEKPEHAVIVCFNYGLEEIEPLYQLEEELEKIIADNNVGEYDGHEIAMDNSDGTLYMYGPNAEKLFKAVKLTLEKTDFMRGATANLRFGPPAEDVNEIEVKI
ncbi:MAG: hypothetical protein WC868_08065 [Bacteroidales bacterium]